MKDVVSVVGDQVRGDEGRPRCPTSRYLYSTGDPNTLGSGSVPNHPGVYGVIDAPRPERSLALYTITIRKLLNP